MPEDPYKYFRLEARELLDQLGTGILDLEKSSNPTLVQRLLRFAHTLKGAARVVKQPVIADAAHAIEDVLGPLREAIGPAPPDGIDALLRHLDSIAGQLRSLDTPGPEKSRAPDQPASVGAAEAGTEYSVRTVRAEIAQMDTLLEGVAETHVLLSGLRTIARSLGQMAHLAGLVTERLAPSGEAQPRQFAALGQSTHALSEELRRGVGEIERQLGSAVDQIDRELGQLRDSAEQLRLAPAAALFTVLERTARDGAQALGKEVVFEASGGDIRLDADILATAQSAMAQIVRNAVAHGIEMPSVRRAAGKPAAGRIAVNIARRGDRIVFTCRDDGAGVDLDGVRRAGLRRGLTAQAVSQLGAQDLINLLLRGGISTSDVVTEISGRGIGLDIVREVGERLGGSVEVTTAGGKGTAFELAVPLSLLAMEVLIVEAGATVAAIPLDAVRSTALHSADAIAQDASGATVIEQQRAIPFLWLPRVFGDPRQPTGRKFPTIIIAVAAGTVAVAVDRLMGTRRTVVHPLPELAPGGSIVAGALFDAEGNPQLVLSPEGLIGQAGRQDLAEPVPEPVRHPVLVVDDSLTTRMLEQSILESAGYEVDLAVSAEEALEVARHKRYALFLVDVEMPGMDGFTFVERVRADPILHDIPAVLVTSRAEPEDRRRGRDAGARGYIVKGEFDQAELLAMIRPLIG